MTTHAACAGSLSESAPGRPRARTEIAVICSRDRGGNGCDRSGRPARRRRGRARHAPRRCRAAAARAALWGLAAGAAACALLAAAATHRVPLRPPAEHLPLQTAAPGDVTSRACRSCHPDQYASWHASYHRTMTQVASPASVLGDFGDARVAFGGERYRMFERGGRARSPRSTRRGRWRRRPRAHAASRQTTGSHHMQIYWFASGAERLLESFPLVWLRDQQRWIPRAAAFVTPPVRRAARRLGLERHLHRLPHHASASAPHARRRRAAPTPTSPSSASRARRVTASGERARGRAIARRCTAIARTSSSERRRRRS